MAKVDKDAQTISLEGKTTERVIRVTAKTKVTKGDKPATLNDVLKGEEVRGSAEEIDGKWEATSLMIGAKVKEIKEEKSKTEKKK